MTAREDGSPPRESPSPVSGAWRSMRRPNFRLRCHEESRLRISSRYRGVFGDHGAWKAISQQNGARTSGPRGVFSAGLSPLTWVGADHAVKTFAMMPGQIAAWRPRCAKAVLELPECSRSVEGCANAPGRGYR